MKLLFLCSQAPSAQFSYFFSPFLSLSLSCGVWSAGFLQRSPADIREEEWIKGKSGGEKGTSEKELSPPDQQHLFLLLLLAAPSSTEGEWRVRQSNLQVKRQTPSLPPSLPAALSPPLPLLRVHALPAQIGVDELTQQLPLQLSLLCLSAVLLLHPFPSLLCLLNYASLSFPPWLMNV